MIDTLAILPAIPAAVWAVGGVASLLGVGWLAKETAEDTGDAFEKIGDAAWKIALLGFGGWFLWNKLRKGK